MDGNADAIVFVVLIVFLFSFTPQREAEEGGCPQKNQAHQLFIKSSRGACSGRLLCLFGGVN